ncbi:MAG: Mur ligase domain-containing protein [Rheinheimera sp.]|nr:Mur ligase domain-containing protein [Rheinheimera sp.]
MRSYKLTATRSSQEDVFLALAGVTGHGNRYIRQAIAAGAALVLTDVLAVGDEALAQQSQVIVWPDLPSVLLPDWSVGFITMR